MISENSIFQEYYEWCVYLNQTVIVCVGEHTLVLQIEGLV